MVQCGRFLEFVVVMGCGSSAPQKGEVWQQGQQRPPQVRMSTSLKLHMQPLLMSLNQLGNSYFMCQIRDLSICQAFSGSYQAN